MNEQKLTRDEVEILDGLILGRTLRVGLAGLSGYVAAFTREGDRHGQVGERVQIRALNALIGKGLLAADLSRIDITKHELSEIPLYIEITADALTAKAVVELSAV